MKNGRTNGKSANGKSKSPFGPNVKLPRHIVLIPDGNRRWAKENGVPDKEGHRRGFDVVLDVARAADSWGIKYFTVWAFSTENWDRSKLEIGNLMRLFKIVLEKHLKEFIQRKVRVVHLGRKDRLPKFLRLTLEKVIKLTEKNDRFTLNIALDYGGRDEIVRAVRKIVADGKDPDKISESEFKKYLDTNGEPEPDLIIRTSGEQRLSGMMPFQAAYAEYYFEKCHLPDFNSEKLKEAILDFSNRQRRFGQ